MEDRPGAAGMCRRQGGRLGGDRTLLSRAMRGGGGGPLGSGRGTARRPGLKEEGGLRGRCRLAPDMLRGPWGLRGETPQAENV